MREFHAARRTYVAVFCALIALLTFVRPASAAFVPGTWYTEGLEGGYLQALVEFKADGSFIKHLRTIEACKIRSQWIETGNWTFQQSQLRFITNMVDGRQVNSNDEYYLNTFTVTLLSDDKARIVDHETRLTWTLTRAAQPFEFPPAPSCVTA